MNARKLSRWTLGLFTLLFTTTLIVGCGVAEFDGGAIESDAVTSVASPAVPVPTATQQSVQAKPAEGPTNEFACDIVAGDWGGRLCAAHCKGLGFATGYCDKGTCRCRR